MQTKNYNSASLHSAHSLALSTSNFRSRTRNNDLLFSKSKDSHLVEWTEVDNDADRAPPIVAFKSSLQLSTHLEHRARTPIANEKRVDMYFLHQRDTWAPLSASWDMISVLADHYDLNDGFFQILSCFRDRNIATEEGFSGIPRSCFTKRRSEFGWIYKYAEKKQARSGTPWRIRHTGIYHLLDREYMRTVLIVISPSPDAQFSTHLKKTLLQPQNRSMILASPMMVHSMLISMHLPSWQEYLEYHEALLLKLDMKSACSVLEQPLVTFDTLKEIREVEKRILPVDPLLKTLEGLLDSLQEASLVFRHARGLDEELFTTIQTALTTMRVETSSYRVQAMYMQRKTQSAAQSVLDALNLAFQQLAQDQSKNTFVMAKSAREDSVAIRAITLVTSFYLPFSFVATMFGMNLVDFDTETRNLLVSNQFWLYFLVSIPLTAITLACWRFRMQAYRKGSIISEANSTGRKKNRNSDTDIEMV